MDISNVTKEQKTSAAVAYLSKNIDKAPEGSRKSLEKLNAINTEGMELVKNINEMRSKIEEMDAEIGQKIGGAKVLFEIVGEQLTDEEVDKFASMFEVRQPKRQESAQVDMAGITAKEKKP